MKKRSLFRFSSRLFLVGLVLVLLVGPDSLGAWPASSPKERPSESKPAENPGLDRAPVREGVLAALQAHGEARVIVNLRDPVAVHAQPFVREAAVAQVQRDVLTALGTAGFELNRQYKFVPALAGTITPDALQVLQAHSAVLSIQVDEPVTAHLAESVPALGADIVHDDFGLTGEGVTVAVLDTGVDTNHPDLSDDIVAQHCFTDGKCAPHGTDEGTNAEDENGHGTHVAGIITSRGIVSARGFAPDAGIVAVRVLDQDGQGWLSDWVAGLDWVLANRDQYNIRLVNMSLGTFQLYPGPCDSVFPAAASVLSQLAAAGVTVFASSGNQGSSTSISAPACNSGVIAVGATYDGNLGYQNLSCSDPTTSLATITCFTNSNSLLDVVAPGAIIRAPGMGGGVRDMFGTSMASPTAAGVAALMLQANSDLTPGEIEALLKSTGTMVTDRKNGLQFPRIDALRAVRALIPPETVGLAGPTSGVPGKGYSFTATVQPVTATVPITYVWQATGFPPLSSTGGLSSTFTFAWSSPGVKTITVTAANDGGSATTTHTMTIDYPAGVTIIGPASGKLGQTNRFTATVRPLTIAPPITYHWQATGHPSIEQTTGLTDTIELAWSDPGLRTITVTATSAAGTFSSTHQIAIGRHYLPLLKRDHP